MAKAKVLSIFYSDPALLDHIDTFNLPKNCLAQVSGETMETLSNAVTPPGIVGMFKRPRQGEGGELKSKNTLQNPLTVLCDGLKDPTNLGMIIMSCTVHVRSTLCMQYWLGFKRLSCGRGEDQVVLVPALTRVIVFRCVKRQFSLTVSSLFIQGHI